MNKRIWIQAHRDIVMYYKEFDGRDNDNSIILVICTYWMMFNSLRFDHGNIVSIDCICHGNIHCQPTHIVDHKFYFPLRNMISISQVNLMPKHMRKSIMGYYYPHLSLCCATRKAIGSTQRTIIFKPLLYSNHKSPKLYLILTQSLS